MASPALLERAMTVYRDLNQPYVPIPYPRMLYATREAYVVVRSATEEAKARADGYKDYSEVDPQSDGLEQRSQEHLIDEALFLFRTKLNATPREAIIADIRAMREAAKAPPAEAIADDREPDFEAMTDDGLRNFITDRDQKAPHHRLGRDRLLDLARGQQLQAAE